MVVIMNKIEKNLAQGGFGLAGFSFARNDRTCTDSLVPRSGVYYAISFVSLIWNMPWEKTISLALVCESIPGMEGVC